VILDLFFRHPICNIVHDVIAQAFFAAFNRPEEYILSVIKSTKVMETILQTWTRYDKALALEDELIAANPEVAPLRFITAALNLERIPEPLREKVAIIKEIRSWGFMGHLSLLANLISGLAKHGEGELKLFIDSQPGWREFVEGPLKVYNAKSQPASIANQWSVDSDEARGHYDEEDEDEEGEEHSDEEVGGEDGDTALEEGFAEGELQGDPEHEGDYHDGEEPEEEHGGQDERAGQEVEAVLETREVLRPEGEVQPAQAGADDDTDEGDGEGPHESVEPEF